MTDVLHPQQRSARTCLQCAKTVLTTSDQVEIRCTSCGGEMVEPFAYFEELREEIRALRKEHREYVEAVRAVVPGNWTGATQLLSFLRSRFGENDKGDLLQRAGTIQISFRKLEENPSLALHMLGRMLVMETKTKWGLGVREFTGFSYDFDIRSNTEPIPLYVHRFEQFENGLTLIQAVERVS